MYSNTSKQVYSSNLQANRSAVDSLLKDLGAEPLFSTINDQPLGIPTPLNEQNNLPLVTYNNNGAATAAQQDQKAFQEAFVSLLQRLNDQTAQNYNQDSQQNQFTNQFSNQNQNQFSNQNSNQFSNQNLNHFSNQNLSNHNSNQNSNQNNSNLVGLPNPISILNEMHQRHKRSSAPPKYSFMIDPTSGQFYCQLEAFGKVFKTERPSVRKQQAKEEVALQALRTLVSGGNNNSSDNINNNNNKRFDGSDIMKLYDPKINYLENRSDGCKSEMWYRKQLNEFPGKQPRVILLEFCQMHHLPTPIYQPNNDYVGNTYFECMIGEKYYFKSDKAFPKSNEAKDYIANVAFEAIYREFCEAEREQFRRRNDMGQDSTRSSLLNFLENHSNISNHISSQSNLNSNHTSNSITSPISRSISTNSNINSSISPHLTTNNNTSLTLPSNSNVNNNSHLNELTTALVLPNFNHEIQNIKVEEASPLNPIIKPEEGNIGNINYSTRDQQQSSSSSISFHPYRSPGRERFPSPGFNNNNSNNNNNQFTKKNSGFCKKFTSLLYEMAQSKRWTPPEFNYENGVNGFTCVCNVQDYLFRGKSFSRKMDAKESAAEEAYRFLTRNFRV